MLLCGEPGVGKSRLMKELRDGLDDEAHSRLLCFAAPYHRSTAFYPIAKQMERVLEFESTDSPARKLERLLFTLDEVGVDVEESGPWIAGLLGLSEVAPWPQRDVEPDQRNTFTVAAVQAIVEIMASKLPVLLVVEDLHWADPSTLELLRPTGHPHFGTYRLPVSSAAVVPAGLRTTVGCRWAPLDADPHPPQPR